MNSIFIHVAIINNYEEIFDSFVNIINETGLINNIKHINVCIAGNYKSLDILNKYNLDKYNFYHNGDDLELFEFPTLNKLQEYCRLNENDNVLYIHTKGVSLKNEQYIVDWRNYMLYFLIENFKNCLDKLNTYDTCGVDLVQLPSQHYSGNFWWAKAKHINTLPEFFEMPIILTERHKAEFWICSTSNNHKSLWNSNIPVLERHSYLYPREKYAT